MDSTRTPQPASETPDKSDEYAQSLLRTVNMEFEARQNQQAPIKHVFSKKRLIYLAISTLVGLVLTAIVAHAYKAKPVNNNNSPSQLINPSSY